MFCSFAEAMNTVQPLPLEQKKKVLVRKKLSINTTTKFKMHFSALGFHLIFITGQAAHFTTRFHQIFSKPYTKKTPLHRKLPCNTMMNLFINFLPIDTLLEPVRNASTLRPTATNAKNVVLI